MKDEIGREFQETTKNRRGALGGKTLDWDNRPQTYKTYPQAKSFQLPKPLANVVPFDDVIRARRSVRSFSNDPLTLEELSLTCCGPVRGSGRSAASTLFVPLHRRAPCTPSRPMSSSTPSKVRVPAFITIMSKNTSSRS